MHPRVSPFPFLRSIKIATGAMRLERKRSEAERVCLLRLDFVIFFGVIGLRRFLNRRLSRLAATAARIFSSRVSGGKVEESI